MNQLPSEAGNVPTHFGVDPSTQPRLHDFTTSPGADIRDAGYLDLAALRAELDFFTFAGLFFRLPFETRPYHGSLCTFLERWGRTDIPGGSTNFGWKRLGVQVSRDCGKTTKGTKAMALWRVVQSPGYNCRLAIFNASEDNVSDWVRHIMRFVETSREFQMLWPDCLPPGVSLRDQERGVGIPKGWVWNTQALEFNRTQVWTEPSISGYSVMASVAGRHFDWIIKDDLIGEKQAYSETECKRVQNWMHSARSLESPAEKGNELVLYTRWHANDPYAYMRKTWPDDYVIFDQPALILDPETGEEKSALETKWTVAELQRMRGNKPVYFYCTPAGTKITMANWELTPIEQIRPGAKVVGWAPAANGRQTLKPASVVDVGSFPGAPVWEYELADGSTVRCTEDHKWYMKKPSGGAGFYAPLGDLEQPSRLCRVHDIVATRPEDREAAAWLAGFFDGEGATTAKTKLGTGGVIAFSQSLKNQVVINRFTAVCDRLGLKFNTYDRSYDNDKWSDSQIFYLVTGNGPQTRMGGVRLKARFLQLCDVARRHQIVETMWSSRFTDEQVPVISRCFVGYETVYWLQTETGNYIANGFASSNSQMQNRPRAGEDVAFQAEWLRYGSFVDDDEGGAFVIEPEFYDPTVTQIDDDEDKPPRRVPLWCMVKAHLWDPAPSEESDRNKDEHSRNGKAWVGLDPWGRIFVFEARGTRRDPVDEMRDSIVTSLRWGCDKAGVEEVNFSKTYKHWGSYIMEKEFPRDYLCFVQLKEERRSKGARILGLIPDLKGGFVYLNRGPMTSQLVLELAEYPYGLTEDIIDALAKHRSVLTRPLSAGEMVRIRERDEMPLRRGAYDNINYPV